MASPTHSPYQFVPLQPTVDRASGYPGIDRTAAQSYSGRLECTLATLTPLFTADQRTSAKSEDTRFLRARDGTPIVQGTSLKGMLRSVYEVLTDSCLPFANVEFTPRPGTNGTLYSLAKLGAHDHHHCDRKTALCPACRLFGAIHGDVFHAQSRVAVSDARLCAGSTLLSKKVPYPALMGPKPHHYEIYSATRVGGGPIAGRKFYLHHEPDLAKLARALEENPELSKAALAELAPKEAVFSFTVTLMNLSEAELRDLLLCLLLPAGFAHKLGFGKPLGFGSCRISVSTSESRVSRGADRYRQPPSSIDLDEFLAPRTEDRLPPVLREMLRWEKLPSRAVGYLPFRRYRGIGLDAEGRYIDVAKNQTPAGIAAPTTSLATGTFSLASMLTSTAATPAAARSPQKGEKIKVEVVGTTSAGFRLRVLGTGQDDLELVGQRPWGVGDRHKVQVVKLRPDGKIDKVT